MKERQPVFNELINVWILSTELLFFIANDDYNKKKRQNSIYDYELRLRVYFTRSGDLQRERAFIIYF
jgi:hypothetical protein